MITLTIHIDAGAAVRAGLAYAGPKAVHLTAEDLASLTDEQRETLARHLDGLPGPWDDGPHWGDPLALHAPPCASADLDTLRSLLDHRTATMRDVMERAHDGGPRYVVSIDGCDDPTPMDAHDSRRLYLAALAAGRNATVRTIYGTIVAGNGTVRVHVRSAKRWARAAIPGGGTSKAGAR